MQIISHIRPEDWAIQTNEAHQKGVAKLAAEFAAEFGMAEWGKVLGLLHDKGKEKAAFQQHIQKESGLTPDIKVEGDYKHAYVGALLARELFPKYHQLTLFWEALRNMFDVDRSAARGLMSAQKLIVFKHDSVLGNAPANKLFDLVKVEKKSEGAPRSFSDYEVTIDRDGIPAGVTLEEMI